MSYISVMHAYSWVNLSDTIKKRCFLNVTIIILIAVAVLAVIGVLIAIILIASKRSQALNNQFGAEFDRTVKAIGGEKKD